MREHLPAFLELADNALERTLPLPIDSPEAASSGVVEPWRVENCQIALANHGSYAAGGTLFWLTLSATPDLSMQDPYSFKELEDMSNKLQLCLVSVSLLPQRSVPSEKLLGVVSLPRCQQSFFPIMVQAFAKTMLNEFPNILYPLGGILAIAAWWVAVLLSAISLLLLLPRLGFQTLIERVSLAVTGSIEYWLTVPFGVPRSICSSP